MKNPIKIIIPAVIGLAIAGGVVGWWVNEIISLSFRSEGNMFAKYSSTATLPVAKNPAPSSAHFCDASYKNRWAGCNVK